MIILWHLTVFGCHFYLKIKWLLKTIDKVKVGGIMKLRTNDGY